MNQPRTQRKNQRLAWIVVGSLAFVASSAATATRPAVNFDITEVMIPMSDGGELAADIYLPGPGRHPTVLTITMSSKLKSRKGQFPRAAFFESGDYAVVCVERRGSLGSSHNPPRAGINPDGKDGHDVVEWIAQQAWSNGKVGMWGASNQGKIQYATAMENPPHLVCIMPAETRPETREHGYPGIEYDRAFPGGVLRLEMMQNSLRGEKRKTGQPGTGMANQIHQHRLDDGFFGRRPKGAPTLHDVKVPIMAIGSWFDNDINRSTTGLFHRILAETDRNKRHRLLVGPWTHNGVYQDGRQGEMEFDNVAAHYKEHEKQFFDYWLSGISNGEQSEPPITYYLMGTNEWKTTSTWPPAGIVQTTYYLHPSWKLTTHMAARGSAPSQFKSDPKNPVPTVGGQNKQKKFGKGPHDQRAKVESHPDVLLYTSNALQEDLTVVGDIQVQVFVSSDSEDTDVAFRLTDVYPDGRSMLLRDGIVRMSLRESRKQYSFLSPGKIYGATMETIPIAYTFRKDHRLRLILSSTNYPRWELNTNRRDKTGASKAASNKLYHDPDHPSKLLLSVLGPTNTASGNVH